MTSLSRATTAILSDVTAAVERGTKTVMLTSSSRSANESAVEFTRDTHATVTSDRGVFTSTAGGNGGPSRNDATQSITTDTGGDVSATRQTMPTTTSAVRRETNASVEQSLFIAENSQVTRDAGGVLSQRELSSSREVTLANVDDASSSSTGVTPLLNETFANTPLTDYQTLFTNALREREDSRLPLALRSSADNASVSAAVGSNVADRRAGSGLLREEVATVGAAVAGVLVFWSLLAFTMCVIVRMRKRQQHRRMRGSDVDAQTAMMEAMVRAELARGRSRVSDSRVPTYVNVAELIPRSSSSCDLDVSDFYHFVLDNNRLESRGVWKKQRYNDVIFGRPRDYPARWQDGSRTIQTRDATYLSTINNCRPLNGREDHHCLLNDAKDVANSAANGQLQCNGLLTKVKSLDSVCKAADEPAVETKHRQRARRRRSCGVRRSASTSRCLVSANNKLASSVNAAANG